MSKKNKKNLIIVVFLLSIIISFISIYKYINIELINYKTNNTYSNLYNLNKIIIVGDSRMELINDDRDSLNIPFNIIFDARSGARFSWFYKYGLPKLFKNINKDDFYNYKVVLNMGVNDLDSKEDPNLLAEMYFNIYKRIAKQNKNIMFYILSVNPVEEYTLNKLFSPQDRTNLKIEKYNNYLINKLNDSNLNNIKYCDSYHNLEFTLPDGIHYDFNTNKKIIDFILKDCIY